MARLFKRSWWSGAQDGQDGQVVQGGHLVHAVMVCQYDLISQDDNIQKIYGSHGEIEKSGDVMPVSMCQCRNHDPCHYQQQYLIFWHVHCSTPR